MHMRSSRGTRAPFVADNLASCHILTNLDDETFHVAVDSTNIAPMVNFDRPTKARHVPACPDYLAAVSSHDGSAKGGSEVDAIVWFPAAAPQLVLHVPEILRNHCAKYGMMHMSRSHDTARSDDRGTCSPDSGAATVAIICK